jgi:hypothetical protein
MTVKRRRSWEIEVAVVVKEQGIGSKVVMVLWF